MPVDMRTAIVRVSRSFLHRSICRNARLDVLARILSHKLLFVQAGNINLLHQRLQHNEYALTGPIALRQNTNRLHLQVGIRIIRSWKPCSTSFSI